MKKRVLIFHQHGSIGGAGLSLLHILMSLDKQKYDVSVVCPSDPIYMSKAIEELGLRVIRTNNSPVIFPHYSGGIKFAFSPRTLANMIAIKKDKKTVVNIIETNNPDIFIVNSLLLSFIGKYVKNKSIVTICFDRETFQKGLFGFRTRIIKRWLSLYFDYVVFLSKYDENLVKLYKGEKIIITDKVELQKYAFTNSDCKKKDFNILFLGGIAKIKGLYVLLRSLNYVKNDVTLYAVADSRIKEKVKLIDRFLSFFKLSSLAMSKVAFSKVNNKERVVILNQTVNPESLFSNADLMIFPSTVPHQSRPLFEAGAAGVPAIISDFRATKEYSIDEFNCLVFKPNNSKDLAKKIDRIIIDDSLRNSIIANNFNMTKMYHNFADLKDELERILN